MYVSCLSLLLIVSVFWLVVSGCWGHILATGGWVYPHDQRFTAGPRLAAQVIAEAGQRHLPRRRRVVLLGDALRHVAVQRPTARRQWPGDRGSP